MAELNFENGEVNNLIKRLSKERDNTCQFAYQTELTNYLTSKLKPYDIPACVIMEIAQYAMVGTLLVVSAENRKIYQDMKKDFERSNFRRRIKTKEEEQNANT